MPGVAGDCGRPKSKLLSVFPANPKTDHSQAAVTRFQVFIRGTVTVGLSAARGRHASGRRAGGNSHFSQQTLPQCGDVRHQTKIRRGDCHFADALLTTPRKGKRRLRLAHLDFARTCTGFGVPPGRQRSPVFWALWDSLARVDLSPFTKDLRGGVALNESTGHVWTALPAGGAHFTYWPAS